MVLGGWNDKAALVASQKFRMQPRTLGYRV